MKPAPHIQSHCKAPYLVATEKGYTKHYYAESERIASKIGGGKLYDLHSIVHDEQVSKKISYNAKLLYHVMECTGSKAKIEDLNLLKILTHLHDSLAPCLFRQNRSSDSGAN